MILIGHLDRRLMKGSIIQALHLQGHITTSHFSRLLVLNNWLQGY
jgi:hypothetical protein